MKVSLQPGYVLHRRPYRESSLLLEVFSRDHGRLGVVARGRRRDGRGASLEPFRALTMGWSGKGELATLGRVEAQPGAPLPCRGRDWLAGFYMNELLLRLLHRHDPHPELFAAYQTALTSLLDAGDTEALLRTFELALLCATGYGPLLEHDRASGEAIRDDCEYYYQVGYGPSRQPPAGESLRVAGSTLLGLAAGRLDTPMAAREGKLLLRRSLEAQLGSRPLASRTLYRALEMLPQGRQGEP